jgi:hypothetical protein
VSSELAEKDLVELVYRLVDQLNGALSKCPQFDVVVDIDHDKLSEYGRTVPRCFLHARCSKYLKRDNTYAQ